MSEEPVAQGTAILHNSDQRVPIDVFVGRPVRRSEVDWTVAISVRVGGDVHEHEPHGVDSLDCLLNGLLAAAYEVNRLRDSGMVTYEGRRDDYFCLDELLRTPATGGYLPTERNGPKQVGKPD